VFLNFSGFRPAMVLIMAMFSLPVASQQSVIRITASLVMVPVSVTDRSGNAINNLRASDFRILENGESEEIAKMFEPGKTPLDLALLFDISGSVNPRFQFERDAATAFLKKVVRPLDSVLIVSIGDEPRIAQTKTESLPVALQSLQSLEPTRGMTAFYDAVVAAARLLRRNSPPETRRVEIVLSDGEDNNSENMLADALNDVQRADCIFYSINPSGPSLHLNQISIKGQDDLSSLASQTGGAAFIPESQEQLDTIFSQIANELQAQYMLGYYPSSGTADGSFRRIVVTVPDRPDLRIRARQGYYAPRS
jgi:Ca-activated chloride channel family protein